MFEVLAHPVTGRRYSRAGRRDRPLEHIQDAFLQGHSIVINSLHRWSEPGLRLARELYQAVDLPVDVYMYLTPPHSKSYGVHHDVMDAWMVQLQGSKVWKVCGPNPTPWRNTVMDSKMLNETCQEVWMRGGDVMYLPFNTLHQATTTSQLSMHLTVNVERQYFIWATLIVAVLHKVVSPPLKVDEFRKGGAFKMEGATKLEVFLQRLMAKEPRLACMPAAGDPSEASRWLTQPLCGVDLPAGYLAHVLDEFRSLATGVASMTSKSKKLARQVVLIGSRTLAGDQVAALLLEQSAVDAVPWALEVARLHALHHFAADAPDHLIPIPELFSTLAAVRSSIGGAAQADRGATVQNLGKLLLPATRLVRRSGVRAVLLLEDHGDDSVQTLRTLHVNSKTLQVKGEHIPAVQFCLGLFVTTSARGQPFVAGEVPGSDLVVAPVLQQLLAAGALEVLPSLLPS